MSGTRILGFVILAVGAFLLIMGINAADSFGEQLMEGLTGKFTDETTWFIILGLVGTVAGLLMAVFGGGHKAHHA